MEHAPLQISTGSAPLKKAFVPSVSLMENIDQSNTCRPQHSLASTQLLANSSDIVFLFLSQSCGHHVVFKRTCRSVSQQNSSSAWTPSASLTPSLPASSCKRIRALMPGNLRGALSLGENRLCQLKARRRLTLVSPCTCLLSARRNATKAFFKKKKLVGAEVFTQNHMSPKYPLPLTPSHHTPN